MRDSSHTKKYFYKTLFAHRPFAVTSEYCVAEGLCTIYLKEAFSSSTSLLLYSNKEIPQQSLEFLEECKFKFKKSFTYKQAISITITAETKTHVKNFIISLEHTFPEILEIQPELFTAIDNIQASKCVHPQKKWRSILESTSRAEEKQTPNDNVCTYTKRADDRRTIHDIKFNEIHNDRSALLNFRYETIRFPGESKGQCRWNITFRNPEEKQRVFDQITEICNLNEVYHSLQVLQLNPIHSDEKVMSCFDFSIIKIFIKEIMNKEPEKYPKELIKMLVEKIHPNILLEEKTIGR